jgi:hypothetical protein
VEAQLGLEIPELGEAHIHNLELEQGIQSWEEELVDLRDTEVHHMVMLVAGKARERWVVGIAEDWAARFDWGRSGQ